MAVGARPRFDHAAEASWVPEAGQLAGLHVAFHRPLRSSCAAIEGLCNVDAAWGYEVTCTFIIYAYIYWPIFYIYIYIYIIFIIIY